MGIYGEKRWNFCSVLQGIVIKSSLPLRLYYARLSKISLDYAPAFLLVCGTTYITQDLCVKGDTVVEKEGTCSSLFASCAHLVPL